MAVRWVLTTISILIMAIVISKVVKKEEVPMDSIVEKKDAVLRVDEAFCISCGLCTRVAPEDFIMLNKKAKVNKTILKQEENEKIKSAIDKCPAKAIKYI